MPVYLISSPGEWIRIILSHACYQNCVKLSNIDCALHKPPCQMILLFILDLNKCIFNEFLCLRYKVAGGIMFSGCPSVRQYVRPYVPFSWSRYLKNRLMDSCQTLVMYVSCRADELIRFWGHKVRGQRSQGSLCMQKQLVIALSEEPIGGFLPNFGHVCILQSRWTD